MFTISPSFLRKMVGFRTHGLVSLAISSSSFLHSPLSSQEFVGAVTQAGIDKIAFLRHGKTGKAENGVDFDRQLTNEGREQARKSGETFGKTLLPFYEKVLVSPAPRTVETAEIFLAAAGASLSTSPAKEKISSIRIQSLYDGTMQPEGSKLFQKLGYSPLDDYVNNEDESDRAAARSVLGDYGRSAVTSIYDTVTDASVKDNDNSLSKRQTRGSTLLVFGHAVYLSAATLAVANLVGCDEDSEDLVLSAITNEAEGFLIDVQGRHVNYLSRPRD